MIVLIATLIGAFLGFRQAKRKGGNRLDILQYAAVYAILFALAGLFVTVMISRSV